MAQNETGAKTIINNGFLEKYMASAPTAYTLVYICAQKFIQEGNEYFTDEQLAQSLGMTEGDIKRAIKFWEDNGEVLRKQRIIQPVTKITHIVSDKPSYAQDEIEYYLKHNAEFKGLVDSAKSAMGKIIGRYDIETIFSFHDWLGLPLSVIEILIQYCCDNGHKNMRYIEKVAIAWADSGINTAKAALEYIEKYNGTYSRIMRSLGLSGKSPVEKQVEYMKKWVDKMPIDLVLFGCEKAAMAVGNGNPFPYADKIFSSWEKKGINSLEMAKQEDERFFNKKDKGSTAYTAKSSGTNVKSTKFTNYEEHEWDYDVLSRLKFKELTQNLGDAGNGNKN